MNRMPLDSVAEILRGTKVDYDLVTDEGVRLLNAKALAEPDADPQYLPRDEFPWSDLEVGDVAIATAFRPGAARVITDDLVPAVLGSDCIKLRARPNGPITSSWLGLWARSSDFAHQVEARMAGSSFPRLSMKAIPDLQVPWVPESQQRRAAQAVERLDTALTELESLLNDVRELHRLEIDLAVFDRSEGAA